MKPLGFSLVEMLDVMRVVGALHRAPSAELHDRLSDIIDHREDVGKPSPADWPLADEFIDLLARHQPLCRRPPGPQRQEALLVGQLLQGLRLDHRRLCRQPSRDPGAQVRDRAAIKPGLRAS